MRKLVLFLLLTARAFATTYNSDGTPSDVQTLVNGAVDGDTVTIPSGSFGWSSGVTISGKGIIISGAGGGRVEGSSSSTVSIGTGTKTFTIRAGSTINGYTVSEAIVVRDKFIAGNTMTGTVTSWDGTTLTLSIASSSGSSPTNFWTFEMPAITTITHNYSANPLFLVTRDASNNTEFSGIRFVEGTATASGSYAINVNGNGKQTLIHDIRISNIHQGIRDGANCSLIWKCYFDAGFNISTDNLNNDNGIQMTVTSDDGSWTAANTVGTNDLTGTRNCYIEQCYFVGLCTGCVDVADNCRAAMRHNVFDNSGITLHGQDTDVYGIRHLEAYNNLMIYNALPEPELSSNQGYWFTWRGGSGVVTDNEMDNVSSWSWGNPAEIYLEYQPLGRTGTINFGTLGWPGGTDGTIVHYPGSHQPGQGSNGAAAWYTYSGSPSLATATNTYTEGVYVWNNTGTTTIATRNFPNNIPGLTPDRNINDYIQVNRDWFIAAPQSGTPYFGYTKYPYPHPNRGGTVGEFGATISGTVTLRGTAVIR